jgi:hypothetical protein
VREGLPLDLTLLESTLDGMCAYHAPLEHGSEVAWSLYLIRRLNLDLTSETAEAVSRMRDNCSLLLLMDLVKLGNVMRPLPDMSEIVERAERPGAPASEDWLLAYEFSRNGWADPAHFISEPHWAELRTRQVGFFTSYSETQDDVVLAIEDQHPDDQDESGDDGAYAPHSGGY